VLAAQRNNQALHNGLKLTLQGLRTTQHSAAGGSKRKAAYSRRTVSSSTQHGMAWRSMAHDITAAEYSSSIVIGMW
jgi:hypothetical protein